MDFTNDQALDDVRETGYNADRSGSSSPSDDRAAEQLMSTATTRDGSNNADKSRRKAQYLEGKGRDSEDSAFGSMYSNRSSVQQETISEEASGDDEDEDDHEYLEDEGVDVEVSPDEADPLKRRKPLNSRHNKNRVTSKSFRLSQLNIKSTLQGEIQETVEVDKRGYAGDASNTSSSGGNSPKLSSVSSDNSLRDSDVA